MAPLVVYILCALITTGCFALLWRGYARNRVSLILWIALFFAAFTLNNALLVVHYFVPIQELLEAGRLATLVGAALLVYGLVKEAP